LYIPNDTKIRENEYLAATVLNLNTSKYANAENTDQLLQKCDNEVWHHTGLDWSIVIKMWKIQTNSCKMRYLSQQLYIQIYIILQIQI